MLTLPFAADTPHLGEFLPPLVAAIAYLTLYGRRLLTLRRSGRPVATWRALSFLAGVLLLVAVQIGPIDSLADEVLIAHMVQHIIIGDFCSLLIVLGLTGPVLQPLLQIRVTRPLRTLANPAVALVLWAVNLYTWHLPFFYQLAIRYDLVHALEHACLLWFGTLLWLALIGPLPKPAWFQGWGEVGYVFAIRLIGAVLGNAFIWAQVLFYPIYRASDAARGLNPVSDQNIAGGIMMVEQIFLTVILLGWVFLRFAKRDDERQELLDLANERGINLSAERAARAANAGTAGLLRERLLQTAARVAPEADPGEALELDGVAPEAEPGEALELDTAPADPAADELFR
jgi:putative membrane protein